MEETTGYPDCVEKINTGNMQLSVQHLIPSLSDEERENRTQEASVALFQIFRHTF